MSGLLCSIFLYLFVLKNPFDTSLKQNKEVINYDPLKFEFIRHLNLKKVTIIPVVIGAFGMTGKIDTWIKKIGIDCQVKLLQKGNLLEMARISWKMMKTWNQRKIALCLRLRLVDHYPCINYQILRSCLIKY